MSDLDVLDYGRDNTPGAVPNAVACLVLGIISIALCWLYGVPGVICGIIALVLHQKDKRVYASNPEKYEQSFKTSKAGFVCAIIGLSLSVLMLVYFVFALFVFATIAGSGFGRF